MTLSISSLKLLKKVCKNIFFKAQRVDRCIIFPVKMYYILTVKYFLPICKHIA